MAKYRFYRDGVLMKSSKVSTDTGKAWIDEHEGHWQLVDAECDRVSPFELIVTTTGGHKLRWVVTEGDGVNV